MCGVHILQNLFHIQIAVVACHGRIAVRIGQLSMLGKHTIEGLGQIDLDIVLDRKHDPHVGLDAREHFGRTQVDPHLLALFQRLSKTPAT